MLRDSIPHPHLPLHQVPSAPADADAAEREALDGHSFEQASGERGVEVLPAFDGYDGHDDGAHGIAPLGNTPHLGTSCGIARPRQHLWRGSTAGRAFLNSPSPSGRVGYSNQALEIATSLR